MKIVRAALASLALLISAPAMAQVKWQPHDGDRLAFDVFRDGSKLGTHILTFKKTGDDLSVDTDVKLKVALGPITFFDYVHDVAERYAGDGLVTLATRTKKDGKWQTVSADAVEGGYQVAGPGFKGTHPGVIIPSTHWNIDEMKQPAMFSTETGASLPMKVTDMGMETVKLAKGTVQAHRYLVKSEMTASFWYDEAGRWVKCAFETQGSKIDYVLRDLPG